MNLDQTDIRILQQLQEPTTKPLTRKELAEKIDSPTHDGHKLAEQTLSEHLRDLDEAGYIKHYTVELNAKKLGLRYAAYVRVYFRAYELQQVEAFWRQVIEKPYVQSACAVTGERTDITLQIITTDSEAYYEILKELHTLAGTPTRIETAQILKEFKRTTALPLDHLHDAPLMQRHRNGAAQGAKTQPATQH